MIRSNKGQITVFLIIGIIVLVVFGGVYYVVSDRQTKTLAAESGKPVSLSVKSQIESYVSTCVKQVA